MLKSPPLSSPPSCSKLTLSGLPLWLLVVLSCAAAAACSNDDDPAGAAALWAKIHEAPYTSWERPAGYTTRQPSNAPHGDSVDIYINDVMATVLAKGDPVDGWPVGSIIAKNGFDEGDLEYIAVMEKRADGWFWVEWDGDGDVEYSGHPDLCIDCHKSAPDGVFTARFPTKLALRAEHDHTARGFGLTPCLQ